MGKRKIRWAAFLLAAVLLAAAGLSSGPKAEAEGDAGSGLRGVWVSTVYNLDYPSKATTDPAKLRAEADAILQNCVEMGMNAVFLQVRPSCDALYPSDLFPWSIYLTGDQNTAPGGGFDPLQYWVEQAHALGLEVHAWLNPFRITKGGADEFSALSPESPAVLHPEWVVEYQKNYYLNPGLPEVRELVIQGAEEIVRGYDVDGIHLDDYFYPGKDFDDAGTFARYGGGFSDIGNWRRDNVNQLIRDLDQRLHAIDGTLSFGVSPSGVWADSRNKSEGSNTTGGYESYSASYADSRKWVKEGWVDYICPQIYWQIGHKSMDYDTIARWWADTVRGTGVRLYIGMADYMADDGKEGSPWYGLDAIRAQLTLNRALPEVAGEVHFRYKFLAVNSNMKGLYQEWYAGETAPVPTPSPSPSPAPTPAPPPVPGGAVELPEAAEQAVAAFLGKLPEHERANWAAPWFGRLGALGIVTGYPDGHFGPDDSVTRGSMAKLVFSSMSHLNGRELAPSTQNNPLSDTAGTWSEPYIVPLCLAGYLPAADYPNGFAEERPMTRLEVAKLLVRALGYRDDGSVVWSSFPDVVSDFYYVAKAAELEIITGYPNGNFGPNDSVTRGAASAMLSRAMEAAQAG